MISIGIKTLILYFLVQNRLWHEIVCIYLDENNFSQSKFSKYDALASQIFTQIGTIQPQAQAMLIDSTRTIFNTNK